MDVDALTPAEREQVQDHYLRHWLAGRCRQGTRRRTDGAGSRAGWFASLDPASRREYAIEGNAALRAAGKEHRFTSAEAREARARQVCNSTTRSSR